MAKPMRVQAIMGVAVLVGAGPVMAQSGHAAASSVARVRADIEYLAADAREGRGVGTAGLDSAGAYLARQMARAGLQPGGAAGYFQPFELDPSAPAVAHAGIGRTAVRNVVGVLPGRGTLAGQAVVLGAHYDHLGRGGMGSLDPDSTGVVHNGADDNASGTAAVLEAARRLADRSARDHRTIVFVAFTAEELGLLGAEHYVRHPVVATDSTYAMLNFDMVGRLRGDTLTAIGAGSAAELATLLEATRPPGLVVEPLGDPWGRSDHSAFYARRIPVTHFFTNTHEDYHRTTDDADKVNVDGVVRVATYAADLAWQLATRPEPLTFVDVPAPRASTTGGGYGAYLGTVPDMSSTPGGVRLIGVRAGSPAEAAGMRAGDILIQLGEVPVGDLYDMTDALRRYRPGDSVTVVVLREGARIETRATLGRRGGE